ncbi:MAG: arginyltransferase [Magnetococcales bacterium]|nr:arginyltransferase [Magnetococcales bacterium]
METYLPSLHLTQPHSCGYLPAHDAATLFVDPSWPMDSELYGWLLQQGFRRSGSHVYRPFCDHCRECVPVRLPVNQFRPQRTLKRILAKNRDVTVSLHPASYNEERFVLYTHYLKIRHADGPMAAPTPSDFCDFLLCDWGETQFVEFRLRQQLVAVAVMDVLPDALSAAYTFFDPTQFHRSLGSLAILWQITHAVQQQLTWLYLGYWIKDCRKMTYKSRFRPLEGYIMHQWGTLV